MLVQGPGPALGPNGVVTASALLEAGCYVASLRVSRVVFSLGTSSYPRLTPRDKTDWNFRIASNMHAVMVTAATLALFTLTDLFAEGKGDLDPVVYRSNWLSDTAVGFSLGFFAADTWFMLRYPAILGGLEMMTHHLISLAGLAAVAFRHEAHNYTLLALSTEVTTPFLNTRWMLDKAGMRDSRAYLLNGVGILVFWLLGRILLFLISFCHLWQHLHEVRTLSWPTLTFIAITPLPLFLLNCFWFSKIVRGALKLFLGSPEQRARHAEEDNAAIFRPCAKEATAAAAAKDAAAVAAAKEE